MKLEVSKLKPVGILSNLKFLQSFQRVSAVLKPDFSSSEFSDSLIHVLVTLQIESDVRIFL